MKQNNTSGSSKDMTSQRPVSVDGEILERLTRIEEVLAEIAARPDAQEYYSTNELAQRLGRAEFTVREWCRLGRIYAEKRACGRGRTREWMVSHEELERIRAHGLLPLR